MDVFYINNTICYEVSKIETWTSTLPGTNSSEKEHFVQLGYCTESLLGKSNDQHSFVNLQI